MGFEDLGPLETFASCVANDRGDVFQSRCDETQLPTVPRGKSVSQRKIFWRSSSGNVIFSSLAEVLHNEDGLLEFNPDLM